ncbi:hypothetical protein [Desulfocurvus sp. DL9XJH121]
MRPVMIFKSAPALAFVALLACLLLAPGGAFADEPRDGVFGYPWSVHTHELEGFTRGQGTELFTLYEAPKGAEVLPGAPVEKAALVFGSTGLFAVYARPADSAAFNNAVDYLMRELGNPVTTKDDELRTYAWQEGKLKIRFVNDLAKRERTMAFYDQSKAEGERLIQYERHADMATGYLPPMRTSPKRGTGIFNF